MRSCKWARTSIRTEATDHLNQRSYIFRKSIFLFWLFAKQQYFPSTPRNTACLWAFTSCRFHHLCTFHLSIYPGSALVKYRITCYTPGPLLSYLSHIWTQPNDAVLILYRTCCMEAVLHVRYALIALDHIIHHWKLTSLSPVTKAAMRESLCVFLLTWPEFRMWSVRDSPSVTVCHSAMQYVHAVCLLLCFVNDFRACGV